MRICILIHAHKNLDFVSRIIKKLEHDDVDIWLNVDKKVDFDKKMFHNCYLVKNRIDVKWGDISQSDATINSLKEIIDSNINYGRIIFISGQDYPIKPIKDIVAFFNSEDNKKKEFIDVAKVSKDGWDISSRYTQYYFKSKILTHLLKPLISRKFIKDYEPYAGSTWFNITLEAAKYIVKKYEEDDFHNYFKRTKCIDEIIIQSILMYKDSEFKNRIINNCKRYIDWSNNMNGLSLGSPNILKSSDYDKMIKSDAFFARKFDIHVDEKIVDKLDNYLDKYY